MPHDILSKKLKDPQTKAQPPSSEPTNTLCILIAVTCKRLRLMKIYYIVSLYHMTTSEVADEYVLPESMHLLCL